MEEIKEENKGMSQRARTNSLIYTSKKSDETIKERIEYLKECIGWLEHYLKKRSEKKEDKPHDTV